MPSGRSPSSTRCASVAPRCARSWSAPRRRSGCSRGPRAAAVDAVCRARPTPASSRSTAFSPDERETIVRARAFQRRFAEHVAREAALLRAHDADARRRRRAAAGLRRGRGRRHSRRSSARTSPGTGSTATTASSPASPRSSQPIGEAYATAQAGVAAADARRLRDDRSRSSTSAVRRAARARADLSRRSTYGSSSGCRRTGRWRSSRSAATACASCRSTVSTACTTGTSCVTSRGRRPAAAAGRRARRRARNVDLRQRPALRGSRRRRRRRHHQAGLRHHLGLRRERHGDALHVARTVRGIRRDGSGDAATTCAAGTSSSDAFEAGRWSEATTRAGGRFRRRRSSRGPTGREVVAAMIAERISAP